MAFAEALSQRRRRSPPGRPGCADAARRSRAQTARGFPERGGRRPRPPVAFPHGWASPRLEAAEPPSKRFGFSKNPLLFAKLFSV